MNHEKLLLAITAAAAVIGAHGRSADACTIHGTATVVPYWNGSSTYNPAGSNDPRCNQSGSSQTCLLQGYYITPSPLPSGALPTVVFIHGSGDAMPGLYCETLNAFVDRGYVVFAPVMRGVAGSLPGASSFPANTGANASNIPTTAATLAYMNDETTDIDSAIHWLVAVHPNRTDLTRLALVGHSYGGATVTIASASTSNLTFVPTVTVSLSGAAMSWSPDNGWYDGMNNPAALARSPMYFQRVVNESPIAPDVGSALEPYNSVVSAGGAARLAAYSAYTPATNLCNDTTPNWHNVHCSFVSDPAGVAIWIDGVIEFFRDYGIK